MLTEFGYLIVETVLHNSVNVMKAPARGGWAFKEYPL